MKKLVAVRARKLGANRLPKNLFVPFSVKKMLGIRTSIPALFALPDTKIFLFEVQSSFERAIFCLDKAKTAGNT